MTFAELPAYAKRVHDLLDDDAELDFFMGPLKCPGEGSVIPASGGLRKTGSRRKATAGAAGRG